LPSAAKRAQNESRRRSFAPPTAADHWTYWMPTTRISSPILAIGSTQCKRGRLSHGLPAPPPPPAARLDETIALHRSSLTNRPDPSRRNSAHVAVRSPTARSGHTAQPERHTGWRVGCGFARSRDALTPRIGELATAVAAKAEAVGFLEGPHFGVNSLGAEWPTGTQQGSKRRLLIRDVKGLLVGSNLPVRGRGTATVARPLT
jgi:hypothetical protein